MNRRSFFALLSGLPLVTAALAKPQSRFHQRHIVMPEELARQVEAISGQSAHAAVWTRALTNAEIAHSSAGGDNRS